jgi:DNA repair exonuclease SbcCD ATPase subunit
MVMRRIKEQCVEVSSLSSNCPLCGRELGIENIDEHHLVPKTFGGKEKEKLHKVCHQKIHATFTERELKNTYHTWQSLKENSTIQDFVKWIQKKPKEYTDINKETKRRKGKRFR